MKNYQRILIEAYEKTAAAPYSMSGASRLVDDVSRYFSAPKRAEGIRRAALANAQRHVINANKIMEVAQDWNQNDPLLQNLYSRMLRSGDHVNKRITRARGMHEKLNASANRHMALGAAGLLAAPLAYAAFNTEKTAAAPYTMSGAAKNIDNIKRYFTALPRANKVYSTSHTRAKRVSDDLLELLDLAAEENVSIPRFNANALNTSMHHMKTVQKTMKMRNKIRASVGDKVSKGGLAVGLSLPFALAALARNNEKTSSFDPKTSLSMLASKLKNKVTKQLTAHSRAANAVAKSEAHGKKLVDSGVMPKRYTASRAASGAGDVTMVPDYGNRHNSLKQLAKKLKDRNDKALVAGHAVALAAIPASVIGTTMSVNEYLNQRKR